MSRHVLALVLVLLLAACSSVEADRELAVQNLSSDGAITESNAQCIVDALSDDQLSTLGNFDPEAEAPQEDLDAINSTITDCTLADVGADLDAAASEAVEELDAAASELDAAVADAGAAAGAVDCSAVDGPCAYGDDADLDGLYDACEGGDDAGCTELYQAAPVGSDYEIFGATCGGRDEAQGCAQ